MSTNSRPLLDSHSPPPYELAQKIQCHSCDKPLPEFSESEVVRILSPPSSTSQVLFFKSSIFEHRVVMKIYDPRIIDCRLFPWTLEFESQAAGHRGGAEAYREEVLYELQDPGQHPEWEEYWYTRCESHYRCEVEAYQRLFSFRGSVIPDFLGHGRLKLPKRIISPPFIPLEYIPDAVSLASIDSKVVPRPLCEEFEVAVRQITQDGGIVHDQMHPVRILFSPANAPTRITLIDFGNAYWEVPDECSDWEQTAFFFDDSRVVRWLFLDHLGFEIPGTFVTPWSLLSILTSLNF